MRSIREFLQVEPAFKVALLLFLGLMIASVFMVQTTTYLWSGVASSLLGVFLVRTLLVSKQEPSIRKRTLWVVGLFAIQILLLFAIVWWRNYALDHGELIMVVYIFSGFLMMGWLAVRVVCTILSARLVNLILAKPVPPHVPPPGFKGPAQKS
jgi:hypothetical protein